MNRRIIALRLMLTATLAHAGQPWMMQWATSTEPNYGDAVLVYLMELSGADLGHDSSSAGNHGTVGGAIQVTTNGENVAYFDGVNDVITIADAASLNISGDITISAWIYPLSTGEGGLGRIVQHASVGGYGFTFYTSDNLRFYAGGGTAVYSAASSISFSQWQHVAVTRSSGTVVFYINGAPSGGGTVSTITPEGVVTTIGNNSSGSSTFYGNMDDVRIYPGAWTQGAVSNTLYGAEKSKYGL